MLENSSNDHKQTRLSMSWSNISIDNSSHSSLDFEVMRSKGMKMIICTILPLFFYWKTMVYRMVLISQSWIYSDHPKYQSMYYDKMLWIFLNRDFIFFSISWRFFSLYGIHMDEYATSWLYWLPFSSIFYFQCSTHTINLIVQEGRIYW